MADLASEIAEAESWNDPARAARAREERDVLLHELAVAAGADGRTARADSSGPFESPACCGRQRDQNDLGALAAHAQHPVAMFLAEVTDVGVSGFEDPQAEQPKHGRQRKVIKVLATPGRWSAGPRTAGE